MNDKNTSRPLCGACNQRLCAPNYYKNGVRHYRSRCAQCIARGKDIVPPKPRWQVEGYVKKMVCDLCGFKAKYSSQTVVYHIDGNLNNAGLTNLRTICLCCTEVVKRRHEAWRQGDLRPDR